MQQELKILKQFDKDGNKRLDAEERKAARDWLASQPAGGFGFGRRGGPFGANAEPPAAGKKLTPADVKSYPARRSTTLVRCGPSSCTSKKAIVASPPAGSRFAPPDFSPSPFLLFDLDSEHR
jgi:hypothetical protein